jgi:hypothetical protein
MKFSERWHKEGEMSPPAFGLLPGQFMIKTYLKGNLITARDGGGHNRDALITSATTVGPNEKFQLTTSQPSFTIISTAGGDFVTAVDGGGATAAAAAFDTTGANLTDFVLFRMAGPRGDGVYTIQTWGENFVTALGGGGRTTEAFHTDGFHADTWEFFYVLKTGDLGDGYNYVIRPAGTGFVPGQGNNPRFISAKGGGGRITDAMTSSTSTGANEIFTVEKQPNGTHALRTASRNLVTAVGNGGIAHPTSSSDTLHTDATLIQAWEQFNIEERSPGLYGIQTGSGFWIGMDPQFKTFSTRIDPPENAGSIGYTALFEFMMVIP